jgi:hypothetical protein
LRCIGTKGEKVVLFGFSIGTKGEKFNFHTTNILNSPLVPILNPKSTTFSPWVPVQRPQEKKSKKVFFGYFYGSKDLIFGTKKFLKIFWQHLVPGTTFKKFIFKT